MLVRNALHLVENHYSTCRKVKDISAKLNVTEATLCREYKKQCGVSCKKMLLFLQVFHGAEQMHDGRMQIKRIAYNNGFKHPERFTEAFLRITGMTPDEYRKQVKLSSFTTFWQEKWQKIKKA